MLESKDVLGKLVEKDSELKLYVKKLLDDAQIPTRGTPNSAGLDLYSTDNYTICPRSSTLVHTGVCIAIPEGYVGLLFIRSSTSKQLLRPTNCVGVIDNDYRGEILLNLFNDGISDKFIHKGDRVGQLVIFSYLSPDIVECNNLPDTLRGQGGFGSTGM